MKKQVYVIVGWGDGLVDSECSGRMPESSTQFPVWYHLVSVCDTEKRKPTHKTLEMLSM